MSTRIICFKLFVCNFFYGSQNILNYVSIIDHFLFNMFGFSGYALILMMSDIIQRLTNIILEALILIIFLFNVLMQIVLFIINYFILILHFHATICGINYMYSRYRYCIKLDFVRMLGQRINELYLMNQRIIFGSQDDSESAEIIFTEYDSDSEEITFIEYDSDDSFDMHQLEPLGSNLICVRVIWFLHENMLKAVVRIGNETRSNIITVLDMNDVTLTNNAMMELTGIGCYVIR